MFKLSKNPISYKLMNQYRLNANQFYRSSMIGGHLMRRKGQSLEFKDYKLYTFGDDIRHVDWKISSRFGLEDDLIIRNFMAEEQLTVLISIDTRDTMRFPEQDKLSKLQIACWAAETIAVMTLFSGDRVFLHRLFGKASNGIIKLNSSNNLNNIKAALQKFVNHDPGIHFNLKNVSSCLPPTGVWLIFTDFYFNMDQQAKILLKKLSNAHKGMRWIILIDLDSWPYEKLALLEGSTSKIIKGPEIFSDNYKFDLNNDSVLKVEKNIEEHKKQFKKNILSSGYDYFLWKWGMNKNINPEKFIKDLILKKKSLFKIFMKDV